MQRNTTASSTGAPFTYYAFISYKRADAKWAAWIQRKLQSYRLPARLCRKHCQLPKRLTPVFLDKENLTSGHLEGSLREEVSASRYLIVICSKNTQIEPYYVNQEIRMFLETGHTPDQIIPFIVDDSPHPEEDCFPPALQEVCAENSLLGVNINDAGTRRAFLKVVAYMHGLKLTEVESAEDRRRRRNGILTVACTLALIAAMAFIGYALWDYYVPKVAYYLDYTTQYGLPVGIHPLTEQEIAGINSHYTLISLGNRRYELRHENAFGNLVDQSNTEHQDRPIHAVYEAPVDGRLDKVTYYNRAGHPTLVMDYSDDLKTVDLEAGGTEFTTSVFLNASTMSLSSSAWESKDEYGTATGKSTITRYLVNYDENGYVAMMRYADYFNRAIADYDGIYGLSYERDGKGRVSVMTYLTHDENAATAVSSDAYSPMNTGICGRRYEYTVLDQLQKTTYFGSDGHPILNEDGWSISLMLYGDEQSPFNLVAQEYRDAQGNLKNSHHGYAGVKVVNDAHGLYTGVSYFDEQGQPALLNHGYCRVELEYDQYGYYTFVHSYDAEGNRVGAENGNYSWRRVNNPQGFPIRETMIQLDDTTGVRDGYATAEFTYDERGIVVSTTYLDAAGNPASTSEGIWSMKFEYDAVTGLLSKATRLNAEGMPVLCADGYAGWRYEYNENGNVVREFYLDEQGQPLLQPNGCAGSAYEYDASGRLTRKTNLDEEGQPVMSSSGYAVYTAVYDKTRLAQYSYADENARPITVCTFAADGASYTQTEYLAYDGNAPINDANGCAVRETVYDSNHNKTMSVYYNAEGVQVMGPGGFSRERHMYENGVRATVEYYNERDLLIMRVGLDGEGNVLHRTQHMDYNENGELICGSEGYATVVKEYNSKGDTIRQRYLDETGRLINAGGFAAYDVRIGDVGYTRTYYNELEQVIQEVLSTEEGTILSRTFYTGYDTDGNLTAGSDGIAIRVEEYSGDRLMLSRGYNARNQLLNEKQYDEAGNLISLMECNGFDENGQPVIRQGYFSGTTTYDADGNLTGLYFRDADGNLADCDSGYAYVIDDYTGGYHAHRVYYTKQGLRINEFTYDAEGRKTYNIIYSGYDEQGQPVENENGYAVCETFYEQDQISSRRYLDVRGFLIAENRYNAQGVRTSYITIADHDEAGNPATGELGFAVRETILDEEGNVTELRYLGPDGELVVRADQGYARLVQTYRNGQMAAQTAYDDKQRILFVGYYDDRGIASHKDSYAAWDKNGNPVNGAEGYAVCRTSFSPDGSVSSITYFDQNGAEVVVQESAE